MRLIVLLVSIAIFISCNKDEGDNQSFLVIENEWHYISYFGAEGPQCNYEREEKIYTFGSSTVVVSNNYFDDDICNETYLEEGVYSFEIRKIDGTDFLFIQDVEQGRITLDEEILLIESSVRSEGVEIDDAPSYRFVL